MIIKSFKKYSINNTMDRSEDDLFGQNEKKEEIDKNEREIVNVNSNSAEELGKLENYEL